MKNLKNTQQSSSLLEESLNNLGYSNVFNFAVQQIKLILLGKIEEYKSQVKFYENKYQMTYQKFEEEYLTKPNKEDFAKEDDGMEWRFNLECVEMYQQDLKNIEKC